MTAVHPISRIALEGRDDMAVYPQGGGDMGVPEYLLDDTGWYTLDE